MKDEITLLNEVMQKIPNKYMAMIVAAKRAKELNLGVRPLVKVDAVKPTTIALNEIAEGLIEPGLEKADKEMLLIDSDREDTIPSPELIIDEIEDEISEADEDEIIIDDEDIDDDDLVDDDIVFDGLDDEDDDLEDEDDE